MMSRILVSILVGIGAALLVWMAGMFVIGDVYSFMQTGPNTAALTRIEMLIFGVITGFAAFELMRK